MPETGGLCGPPVFAAGARCVRRRRPHGTRSREAGPRSPLRPDRGTTGPHSEGFPVGPFFPVPPVRLLRRRDSAAVSVVAAMPIRHTGTILTRSGANVAQPHHLPRETQNRGGSMESRHQAIAAGLALSLAFAPPWPRQPLLQPHQPEKPFRTHRPPPLPATARARARRPVMPTARRQPRSFPRLPVGTARITTRARRRTPAPS